MLKARMGTENLRRHMLTCQRKQRHEVGQFLVTSDKGIRNIISYLESQTTTFTRNTAHLTAHYVDSNWVLRKRILNFSHFSSLHSGIALAEKKTAHGHLLGNREKTIFPSL
ncbi:hypothetical protein OSB04_007058 [Centaurea solstitialis]|uniref:Uncharacterized protein n=1 Tax=Centaurea solstitialis TaxID=347529 RepID=A0AA38TJ44_9ASTR|nr:hypothetical protein OSB04_007058 [Centaurea solstitialis]